MSELEESTKTEEISDFYKIKDFDGKVVYTTTPEELEEVLVNILAAGKYTKTFSLLNGKIELTYDSITDAVRSTGFETIRKYTKDNEDKISRIQMDNYSAKVNIALQLVRIKTNGIPTNMSQGTIEERLMLLTEQPEQLVALCSQYLTVFSTITAKAFSSDGVIKK